MGVQLLGHDVVIKGAAAAAGAVGAAEHAVEGPLVVLVELDAHAVPVTQQLARAACRPEVHQACARVLRLLRALQRLNTSGSASDSYG